MQKAELLKAVLDETGLPLSDIKFVTDVLFKKIKATNSEGEPVFIRGFGTFIAKKRAAKLGRNINTNEIVPIPEHFIPAFKPGIEFKESVRNNMVKKSNIETYL